MPHNYLGMYDSPWGWAIYIMSICIHVVHVCTYQCTYITYRFSSIYVHCTCTHVRIFYSFCLYTTRLSLHISVHNDYVYLMMMLFRLFLSILLKLFAFDTFWTYWWCDVVLWCWWGELGVARPSWSTISYRAWRRIMFWPPFPSTTTQPPWCYRESWRGHWRRRLVSWRNTVIYSECTGMSTCIVLWFEYFVICDQEIVYCTIVWLFFVGRTYGPPGMKQLIYFIDDMNMPEVDTYGTVQPHTLIRQHLDYQHW